MNKSLNKINLTQYAENIYEFIIKYKYIILISFLTGIIVNAVDVFTIKFGIDSELYAIIDSPQIYYDTQRYGSWLLYYLIPFARYHIVSQIIGIFTLTLAGLLTVSRHNLPNSAKLLFVLLFVTYPNFAFLQYFYFQSAYNFIGLLLVVIAYRLIEKNNILLYILALILLFIGISSYQANIAIYLCVVMINVILDFINDKNYKKSIKMMVCYFSFLLAALILYYVIIQICSSGINEYHKAFLSSQKNIIDSLGSLITYVYRILINYHSNAKHTANILVTIFMVFSIIYVLIRYYNVKFYLYLFFLMFCFMLSVFSINIFAGGYIVPRAELSNAFYPAFILMILYLFNINNKIRYIVVITAIVIINIHAFFIVKNQMAYYITYKHDEYTAQIIINKIYNRYPEIEKMEYKIYVSGILQNKVLHPLMKGKDMFNISMFSAPDRILNFLKLQGFPMDIQLGNITDDIMNNIKDMPAYPDNDCVQLINDTVIIKLSN